MARRLTVVLLAGTLGLGSALGAAACGEDREGGVEFEDGTGTDRGSTDTGTGRTGATGTTPKAPTNTAPRTTTTGP